MARYGVAALFSRRPFGIKKPARIPRGFQHEGSGLTRPVLHFDPSEPDLKVSVVFQ
jgi:hypothetical protein